MMLRNPRDAYLMAYGPRQLDWRGLHIRVDSQFVLVAQGNHVLARRVVYMPPMLGPGVTCVDIQDTARAGFARALAKCASEADRCVVHRAYPPAGQSVCLQYLEHSANTAGEDLEVWRCRLPTGIEARYAGSVQACAEYDAIVRSAFATAQPVGARTVSGANAP